MGSQNLFFFGVKTLLRTFFVHSFTLQIKLRGSFHVEAAFPPFRVVWLLFSTLVIFFGHSLTLLSFEQGINILAEKNPSIPAFKFFFGILYFFLTKEKNRVEECLYSICRNKCRNST